MVSAAIENERKTTHNIHQRHRIPGMPSGRNRSLVAVIDWDKYEPPWVKGDFFLSRVLSNRQVRRCSISQKGIGDALETPLTIGGKRRVSAEFFRGRNAARSWLNPALMPFVVIPSSHPPQVQPQTSHEPRLRNILCRTSDYPLIFVGFKLWGLLREDTGNTVLSTIEALDSDMRKTWGRAWCYDFMLSFRLNGSLGIARSHSQASGYLGQKDKRWF